MSEPATNKTNFKGPLLKVEGLEKRFGGLVALSDYSVEIASGELMGLIGPNGAGKTTVFNLLSGVLPPTGGSICFCGEDITGQRPDQNAFSGISRTFQNIRLFNELSVLDNIKTAFHMHSGKGLFKTLFNLPGYKSSEKEMTEKALEYLEILNLVQHRHTPAGNLPYGLMRKVEIARALAARPKLLLLDEPAAGMNPNETEELTGIINLIHGKFGLTIFLVEHDMKVIMGICERIQVINQGRVLTQGSPHEVQNNPEVIKAYLGSSTD